MVTLIALAGFSVACSDTQEGKENEGVAPKPLKEQLTEGYASFGELEKYQTKTSFDIDLDLEAGDIDPGMGEYLQTINDGSFVIKSKVDEKEEKNEVIIETYFPYKNKEFHLEIPIVVEKKDQKVFIGIEKLRDVLKEFNPVVMTGLPEGDVLGIDLSDEMIKGMISNGTGGTNESNGFNALKVIQNDLLKEKSNEDFRKTQPNEIEVIFTEEEVKAFMKKVIEKQEGKEVEDEDIFSGYTLHELKLYSTIENGMIKKDRFIIDFEIKDNQKKVRYKLTINNTYDKLKEEIDYSINIKDNVIDLNQLLQKMFTH